MVSEPIISTDFDSKTQKPHLAGVGFLFGA